VAEEGFKDRDLMIFARDSFGLQRRHHQELNEVVVGDLPQIDLPVDHIPPVSYLHLVHH